MYQIQEHIVNALNNAGQQKMREQAQEAIFQLLRSNPPQFFVSCSQIIGDNKKNDTIRQSAATVMKALIAKKDQNNGFYWDWIQPQQKQIIKQALINNLISPNLLVMRAGANAIAQIAAIQIPRNQWLQIVNSLATNAIHQQYNIRRASITTLGFICEQLRGVKSNINKLSCQQILGSILIGLNQQGGDIIQISIQALRNSISFLTNILESQEYCEKLFEYLLPVFLTEHKRRVYEVLFEFGKYCYHLLFGIDQSYVNKIVQFSLEHIQSRSQISISALEFWDTLGCEFMRRMDDSKNRINSDNNNSNNILQQYHHVILPQIMASIIIVNKNDYNFPELREIAVKTLGTFVECCNRDVVDKITDGVSRVIASPKAGERQASVLLFSSLSHFADHDYILSCFKNGFVHLYQLINDNEIIVKKNTLNGFSTLSQVFPEVFLQNNDLLSMFDHLLGLTNFNDEDIDLLGLTILSNITDFLKEYPTCKIVQQPSQFLQKLIPIFTNNLEAGNQQRNEKIIIIILNITMNTNKKDVIIQLTNYLIEQYENYSKAKIQDKNIVLQQIITIIHTCILALAKFTIPNILREKIYDIIDSHIRINGIEAEGINMISGAAICFKKQFFNRLQKYWNPILSGLQSKDQKPLFRASLSCISDISRNFQSMVASKIIPVFEKLLNFMHENIDRELKCQILKCFGDLCLGLKDYGQNYVQKLISISQTCFVAVYQLSQIESQKQYAQQLKQSLIEMYHCVVFAQNEQNRANRRLADHFPLISTFIVNTCDVKYKPTVDYLRQCLYLIFDSALFYSKHRDYKQIIDNIINSNEIKHLIGLIEGYRDKPQIHELLNFIQDKMKMYRR